MDDNEILGILKEKYALLSGHFLLSSGLHSDRYVQCAQVLQYPDIAEELAQEVAVKLLTVIPKLNVNVVVSPAMGGLIIGQEVGRELGCRAIFTEREQGVMTLRRGFKIEKGERAVIVEDVITTGKSTKEVLEVVNACGAKAVAAVSIIDRSSEKIDFGMPQVSLIKLDIKTYQPDSCPLCKQGTPAIKPGSRK